VTVIPTGIVIVIGLEAKSDMCASKVLSVGVGFEELQDTVEMRNRLINARSIITKTLAVSDFVDPILLPSATLYYRSRLVLWGRSAIK
jgi:hypothetical protein